MILAVDVGLRACGCAVFDETMPNRFLSRAAYVRASPDDYDEPVAWFTMAAAVRRWAGDSVTRVVFEQPGFRRTDGKQNQKSRESLIAVGASIAALYPGAWPTRVFPSEWEGSLKRPKTLAEIDPIIQRVRGRLFPEEIQRIELPAPSLAHNTWDAIGIGLWFIGRLDRKKYYGPGLPRRGLKHATP